MYTLAPLTARAWVAMSPIPVPAPEIFVSLEPHIPTIEGRLSRYEGYFPLNIEDARELELGIVVVAGIV